MNSGVRELKPGEVVYGLIKLVYSFLGIPVLLLFGIATLFAQGSASSVAESKDIQLLSVIVWTALVVPVAFLFWARKKRAKQLYSIVQGLKSDAYFQPSGELESFSAAAGTYFGLDARNGTVLFVRIIRRGQVDVVGLSMDDWTARELDGKTLRLYTKLVDLPCIEIPGYSTQHWYDTLGAMESRRYSTPKPFRDYIRDQVQQLERDHKILIPRLT